MRALLLIGALIYIANVWSMEPKEACDQFLKSADNKEYAKTWEDAAPYFQKAITQTQWQASMEAVRTPLGKVSSRKQISSKQVNSLPGAPDGNYTVIQYETSFSQKKSATETITFHEQADKSWKLVGYYIK